MVMLEVRDETMAIRARDFRKWSPRTCINKNDSIQKPFTDPASKDLYTVKGGTVFLLNGYKCRKKTIGA